MKILLIGKSGQLGSSLLDVGQEHQWIAPNRSELDIESDQLCRQAIAKHQPEVIINTAAFHNVPACETSPERALAVNSIAVGKLAKLCADSGILFVTYSSDYVFNGFSQTPYQEHNLTQPLQMYGISRVAGENAALAYAPNNAIVIRTCGLYGAVGATSKGGNFVDNRIHDALHASEFEMGCDQIVSPTSALDLARATLALLEHPDRGVGIYHLVNDGQCSWYEFTCKIVELMQLNSRVTPVDRKGLSGNMRRPLYSAMANTRAKELGVILPHWEHALAEYIETNYVPQKGS